MASARILIVDDEAQVRWSLKDRLTTEGYDILEAGLASEALDQLSSAEIDVVLLDFKLPDGDGLTVLKRIKEGRPELQVIVMTAPSSIGSAVDAMKAGAYHYVTKPFNLDEVVMLLQKALEMSRLRLEKRAQHTSQINEYSFDAIVGSSPAMQATKAELARVAGSSASPVLLTGEPGTGRELAARTIHYNSDRARGSFIKITTSAAADQMLESDIFGHERTALTDARQPRRGFIETAHGGTLFFDEIGELTAGLQAKLLRFLEEKTFRRVGGLADIRVDVRVIAATTRNLEKEVSTGRFREDLFYRLQVTSVALPPLRERHGDIPLLTSHYRDVFNREFKRHVRGVSPPALGILEQYQWPGNVRELRIAIERAVLLVDRESLEPSDFTALTRSPTRRERKSASVTP